MSEVAKTYCALRFRSTDDLHKKGDVLFMDEKVLYIGQTDECAFRLEGHPDFADSCYAVVVRNEDGSSWRIVRQNEEADITVNGIALDWVNNLHDGDLLKFDKTLVQFTVEQGTAPKTHYMRAKTPWGMWAMMAVVLAVLAGVVIHLHRAKQKPATIYKREIASICKIEADKLLVLTSQNDTLEVVPADKASVGTGFITDNGYFVTARHCVEFWIALENELKPNLHDIKSRIVRRAIDAEMDSSIRIVALLTITSHDGLLKWSFSSEDFTMDKSHDDVYECGGFETPYLWRSVVSMFEKRDAELGDVAVMKWPWGKGTIKLEDPDKKRMMGDMLYGFGYPQNESRQESVFSSNEGAVYQDQKSPEDCFICEKGFDPGFSGGPVFDRSGKAVVGIVSRSDGNHTLIVPVAQVHHLISKLNSHGK